MHDAEFRADAPLVQSFKIHDRAEGNRYSMSSQGVGHDDYHNQVIFSFAEGPCLVGKATTHLMMRGYLLPLTSWLKLCNFKTGVLRVPNSTLARWRSLRASESRQR